MELEKQEIQQPVPKKINTETSTPHSKIEKRLSFEGF